MAYQDDIILAVADDPGVQTWLASTLEEVCRLEQISRNDLMRALRMLEATGSQLVLVEVVGEDLTKSLSIISAITNARPWVTVVALCRHPEQQLLLKCMRAGARDCLVLGGDAAEARDRLREHQQVRHQVDDNRISRTHNLLLLTSASPVVDTALLSQELAVAINQCKPGERLLAIDMQTRGNDDTFYLENSSEFGLMQLLQNPDTLDESMVNTAIEEYRPGLRLLRGDTKEVAAQKGDYSADLFIVLSHLMDMFDTILINVGYSRLDNTGLVQTLGIHAKHVLFALHPQVDQIKTTRELAGEWQPYLSSTSDMSLLLDGVESNIPPSAEEVASSSLLPVRAQLPMDWPHRLEAKNLGLPVQEVAPRSPFSRKIQQLAADLVGVAPPSRSLWKRNKVVNSK